MLPAGKYKVVQKLVDTAGTTKSFTAYVNLSTKKLVTVTKTITKNGSALAAFGGKVCEVRDVACASRAAAAPRSPGGSSRSRPP